MLYQGKGGTINTANGFEFVASSTGTNYIDPPSGVMVGDIAILVSSAYDNAGTPPTPTQMGTHINNVSSGTTRQLLAYSVFKDALDLDRRFYGMEEPICFMIMLVFRKKWHPSTESFGIRGPVFTHVNGLDSGSSFMSFSIAQPYAIPSVYIAAMRTNPTGPDFYTFGCEQQEIIGNLVTNNQLSMRYVINPTKGCNDFLAELNDAGDLHALQVAMFVAPDL